MSLFVVPTTAAPPAVPPLVAADGAALLVQVARSLDKYVVTPSAWARDAISLWIAATHAQKAWNHAPRLVINSPEKRCGKTRLLEIIEALSHEPLMTANVSTAALYRIIGMRGDSPPTILLDEADTIFGTKIKAEQNEDLRGLFNAGHSRGATTWRCVGPMQTPTEFRVYSMAALAGIGSMPDTITDRAVNITMRRRAAGETVAPYRETRDKPGLAYLRDELAQWVGAHLDELEKADPETKLEDRAADNWAPLFAVADLAGGDWPEQSRAAALGLTAIYSEADAGQSLNVQLLDDCRSIWKHNPAVDKNFISSVSFAATLRKDESAPWGEIELTARRLAVRLAGFGIKPGHNLSKTERGYRREHFTDAFARYLQPEKPEKK